MPIEVARPLLLHRHERLDGSAGRHHGIEADDLGVVQVEHVDAVDSEAGERLVERAAHPVATEIAGGDVAVELGLDHETGCRRTRRATRLRQGLPHEELREVPGIRRPVHVRGVEQVRLQRPGEERVGHLEDAGVALVARLALAELTPRRGAEGERGHVESGAAEGLGLAQISHASNASAPGGRRPAGGTTSGASGVGGAVVEWQRRGTRFHC